MAKKGGVNQSPLFWPVELKGNTIYILDETLLPQKIQYIKAKTYLECCRAIRQMKTRAVGQVSIVYYMFLLELKKNKSASKADLLKRFKKISQAIESSRPTFPFYVFTGMIQGWLAKAEGAIIQQLEARINGFLQYLKKSRLARAERVAALLKNKNRILTHCNISGELVAIAQACKKRNNRVEFFATETRPYLQGSRLTAWELRESGFKVTVVSDSSVASLFSKGMVDAVVVGSDRSTSDKAVINKVGTYQIASLAKAFNIPFYALIQPASANTHSKDVVIEQRPDEELVSFNNKRLAPEGTKAYYPAFDITPNELVTKQIAL
ncbi:hypothetical protein ACFL38_01040 [Candidatus Omnitrophota bacterium]